jgi:hypothetical protein
MSISNYLQMDFFPKKSLIVKLSLIICSFSCLTLTFAFTSMISVPKCDTSKYLLGECGRSVQIALLMTGKFLTSHLSS